MSKSYFEIGGEIFECNITSIPSSNYSPSSFRGAPTTMSEGATPRNKQGAGGRKGDHPSISDLSTVPGRTRRSASTSIDSLRRQSGAGRTRAPRHRAGDRPVYRAAGASTAVPATTDRVPAARRAVQIERVATPRANVATYRAGGSPVDPSIPVPAVLAAMHRATP